jgi:hypothetical protein
VTVRVPALHSLADPPPALSSRLQEYLEANFYKCARDGKPLSSELRGGGPAPIGCKKAQGLDAESLYLLRQIAADEIAHVRVSEAVALCRRQLAGLYQP